MFNAKIVWRGVVYAILMAFGKLITGLWLVRFSSRPVSSALRILKKPFSGVFLFCASPRAGSKKQQKENQKAQSQDPPSLQDKSHDQPIPTQPPTPAHGAINSEPPTQNSQPTSTRPPKPKSLYPASILGLAMVSRGEVGYLIASLAESKGIFGTSSSGGSSETYLVIVWAISLCTLFGPICVGTLVKRVKTLQRMRVDRGGEDPLGVWGI